MKFSFFSATVVASLGVAFGGLGAAGAGNLPAGTPICHGQYALTSLDDIHAGLVAGLPVGDKDFDWVDGTFSAADGYVCLDPNTGPKSYAGYDFKDNAQAH